jgi:hypothetical protein
MDSSYCIKLKFKNRYFTVWIKPKLVENLGFVKFHDTAYDLEIETKGSLSGDDFTALSDYLKQEGYIEAAKEFLTVG